MHELSYPNPPLYYISYNIDSDGKKHPNSYGLIESNQCLTTGLENIETFEQKSDYLSRLTELGIEITEITEVYLSDCVLLDEDGNEIIFGN